MPAFCLLLLHSYYSKYFAGEIDVSLHIEKLNVSLHLYLLYLIAMMMFLLMYLFIITPQTFCKLLIYL